MLFRRVSGKDEPVMEDLFVLPNRGQQYFTLDGYRALLIRARDLGYRMDTFREFSTPEEDPILLLRHDLDHSLAAAITIGEIEQELGIRSTFFVQTASAFYNLLAPEGRAIIRSLSAMGHEIGLQYEARRYVGSKGERALLCDLSLLEDLADEPVVSAAQQLPIDDVFVSLKSHIENEAHESRFTEAPMHFASDSLMSWRHATPHDLLDRRASFQLLTHPETWTGNFRHMEDALQELMEKESCLVRERFRKTIGYYAWLQRDLERRRPTIGDRGASRTRAVGDH